MQVEEEEKAVWRGRREKTGTEELAEDGEEGRREAAQEEQRGVNGLLPAKKETEGDGEKGGEEPRNKPLHSFLACSSRSRSSSRGSEGRVYVGFGSCSALLLERGGPDLADALLSSTLHACRGVSAHTAALGLVSGG